MAATRAAQHVEVPWRRREPPLELPLSRDDVLAIFGALADLKARTIEILRILGGEEDEAHPGHEP